MTTNQIHPSCIKPANRPPRGSLCGYLKNSSKEIEAFAKEHNLVIRDVDESMVEKGYELEINLEVFGIAFQIYDRWGSRRTRLGCDWRIGAADRNAIHLCRLLGFDVSTRAGCTGGFQTLQQKD